MNTIDAKEESRKIIITCIPACKCDEIYTKRDRHNPYCIWGILDIKTLEDEITQSLTSMYEEGEKSGLPKGRIAERDCIQAEVNAGAITQDVKCSIKPPKNHIIDEDGTIREVIGLLPLSGDSKVVGVMNPHIHDNVCKSCGQETSSILLWHPDFDSPAELHGGYLFVGCTDRPMTEFYTSKEAANKAKMSK